MTNVILIEATNGVCAYCGQMDELRPYGLNGAKICFDCGMKPENIKTTETVFDGLLKPSTQTQVKK